ncbi:HGxxPAAW family protein [Streptomyces sp. NPDC046859]|uniref:HGxxPAAW family protein n=1 Tax=Streptomyces sp. NPDC046859 TaxID=3155734 RepID=UPI003408D8E2
MREPGGPAPSRSSPAFIAVATVGCSVLGAGICVASAPLIVGGLAVTVTSVLVTWVLHLTGWGKPSGIRPRGQWGMRVRDLSAREGHPNGWGCRLAGRGLRTAGAPAPVGGAAVEREPVAVGAER